MGSENLLSELFSQGNPLLSCMIYRASKNSHKKLHFRRTGRFSCRSTQLCSCLQGNRLSFNTSVCAPTGQFPRVSLPVMNPLHMYIGTFPKLNAGSGRVQMPIINADKHPAAATAHDKLQRTYPPQKGRLYSFINCSGSRLK